MSGPRWPGPTIPATPLVLGVLSVVALLAMPMAAAGLPAPSVASPEPATPGFAPEGGVPSLASRAEETLGRKRQPTPLASQEEEHAEPAAQEEHAAAEGEHAAEEEHEPAPWWEFPARLVNFGLLLALLWWGLVRTPPAIGDIFSFPGLAPLLANRSSQIKEDKAVARERKEEAAEILTSTAARLDRIEVEVGELVEEAREDAEREKRRAEEEGREQAEKIRETARRELRAESLGAQRELRAFVADLAVGMARKTLREHLTPADQERLRQDYLSRIGTRLQMTATTPGAQA